MRLGRRSAPLLPIALLTIAAVLIHGYHFGADDAAIYLAAVKKIINPQLYPFGTEFFLSHERLSVFARIVGGTARISHLPGDLVIFVWYIASVFVFLLAAWLLLVALFDSAHARWSGLLLSTTLMTLPVAGTALPIMDPYLTARSGSTPMTMLAIAAFLSGRREMALFWLVMTALVHPQMAVYGFILVGALSLPVRSRRLVPEAVTARTAWAVAAGALPGGFKLGPASPEYRTVLYMRTFFFLQRWTWYEWGGLFVPVAMLAWFGHTLRRGSAAAFPRVCRALVIFGVASFLVGLLFSLNVEFENFVRLQPLRAFQLIYIFFFLILGGVTGEYILQHHRWRWIVLFTAIGTGMFFLQLSAYPYSRHVEWPLIRPKNQWVSAFLWARDNTPKNAVFALDPVYMRLPGEDRHGFRAIAERSMLSDYIKDSGVVSLFPQMAGEWQREQQAQAGWKQFQLADFDRLARKFPVSWVVLSGTVPEGLDCRYRNAAVTICLIPGAPGLR